MKIKNISKLGVVVEIKDEGEETAETYQSSLSKEMTKAMNQEEEKRRQ